MTIPKRTPNLGIVAVVLVVAALSGCKSSRTQAELEAVQADWKVRIGNLRGREAESVQRARAAQERLSSGDGIWAQAMRRRIDATLIAGNQGLLELECQVDRVAAEVKAASDAEEALNTARVRMAASLAGEEETLKTIQQDIELADRGEPQPETAELAKGDGQ